MQGHQNTQILGFYHLRTSPKYSFQISSKELPLICATLCILYLSHHYCRFNHISTWPALGFLSPVTVKTSDRFQFKHNVTHYTQYHIWCAHWYHSEYIVDPISRFKLYCPTRLRLIKFDCRFCWTPSYCPNPAISNLVCLLHSRCSLWLFYLAHAVHGSFSSQYPIPYLVLHYFNDILLATAAPAHSNPIAKSSARAASKVLLNSHSLHRSHPYVHISHTDVVIQFGCYLDCLLIFASVITFCNAVTILTRWCEVASHFEQVGGELITKCLEDVLMVWSVGQSPISFESTPFSFNECSCKIDFLFLSAMSFASITCVWIQDKQDKHGKQDKHNKQGNILPTRVCVKWKGCQLVWIGSCCKMLARNVRIRKWNVEWTISVSY